VVQARGGNSNKSLQGARPKISQRHTLCTHIRTYNLDYVSIYLDSRVLKEKRERSHREVSGRELELGLTSQNNLDHLQIFVDYLNYN
jgi:hypothetical protein